MACAQTDSAAAVHPQIQIRPAREEEAERLFELVNEAYSIEKGDTGLAFKNTDRYITPEETVRDIRDGIFLVATTDEDPDAPLLGCVNGSFSNEEQGIVGHYGPFAVSRAAQGRGVGTALLDRFHEIATEKRACRVDIEVVNWRTDLMSYYDHRGYLKASKQPGSDSAAGG